MTISLDPIETRILGCLLEKERLTPDHYPLSLNALTNACNQSTNRDPVVGWDEVVVEKGLDRLRSKQFAVLLHAHGSRVPKYRHTLPEQFTLDSAETAILCVLLLRGPQTLGEIRARVERMSPFETLDAAERCLAALIEGTEPLIELLSARPGQKERRYIQLLSGRTEPAPSSSAETIVPLPPDSDSARLEALEKEMQSLQAELQTLRDEFSRFRKQFE